MFTLCLQEQTDDEMMMIQRYAHAFVMTLLLLCSVLKHMCLIICGKIEKKKKKGHHCRIQKLCTLQKRRADQSVEPIVFIWLRVTAKGGRLIKKFHKSGKCFLTLCVNGSDNVLHPFKQC